MDGWVKKLVLLVMLACALWYWQHKNFDASIEKSQAREQFEQAFQAAKDDITQPIQTNNRDALTIAKVHAAGLNHVPVIDQGKVIRILPDDHEGNRHQRFIVRTQGGTVLIAHNIDVAPRLSGLMVGDQIGFSGEFIQNKHGGLVHWTHCGVRQCQGWLHYRGRIYQ